MLVCVLLVRNEILWLGNEFNVHATATHVHSKMHQNQGQNCLDYVDRLTEQEVRNRHTNSSHKMEQITY